MAKSSPPPLPLSLPFLPPSLSLCPFLCFSLLHWQIVGLRQYYFYSKWNIFDFFILLVSLVDIIVELSLPESTSSFSPAVLRIIRVFRILRVGRGLRLVKVRGGRWLLSNYRRYTSLPPHTPPHTPHIPTSPRTPPPTHTSLFFL